MINLIFAAVGIIIAFNLGAWHTESKYERILADYRTSYIKVLKALQASWEKERHEVNTGWTNHCKSLREHYEKALMEKHSNEEGEDG